MAIDQDVHVRALEALVASQADRIHELEALLGLDEMFSPPLEWGLARREAQIFGLLVARERVTKDALHAVLYGSDSAVDPTSIESHVSKLRRKLAAVGVEIRSERHQGYWLVDRQKYRRES